MRFFEVEADFKALFFSFARRIGPQIGWIKRIEKDFFKPRSFGF